MTDKDLVHYVIIVDRSGSMQSIKTDTEGGIRAFIDGQLEGVDSAKRTVSFFQFDTAHDCLWDFTPLEKAKGYTLEPRGMTALLDACGRAITDVGRTLKNTSEDKRPGQVMVVIATDGQENSSKEYNRAEIKKMIEHQQDTYGWKFTYIGANQDVFAEAGSLGISRDSAICFTAQGPEVASVWASASAGVSMSTAPTSGSVTYSSAQRRDAMGK